MYINIPYVPENDRIDRDTFAKELEAIDISEDSRFRAFAAVYGLRPRRVNFEITESDQLRQLLNVLGRFGIGYRVTPEPEYI
jgi:hypothetical protein